MLNFVTDNHIQTLNLFEFVTLHYGRKAFTFRGYVFYYTKNVIKY